MSYHYQSYPSWPYTPPDSPEPSWSPSSPQQYSYSGYLQSPPAYNRWDQQDYDQYYSRHRLMSEQHPSGGEEPMPGSSTQETPLFLCLQKPCDSRGVGFARKADLLRHVETVHEGKIISKIDCEHPSCHRKGEQGFTRKDKMVQHMREVHKADVPKRQNGARRVSRSSR